MKELWSRRVKDMTPYVPGEQPQDRRYIKLNTNENPYPPSPMALAALREAANEDLRLYPDPECVSLRRSVAALYGLSPENVFCGNGSDEILSFSFQAFFDKERPVAFPDITYSFYEVFVKYLGLTVDLIPLREDFSLPAERFLNCPGGVVLANPNAPTGQWVELDTVEEILKANQGRVVILDEAYVDFGSESGVQLIEKYPNLLVVQTLSKSRSLAGLRVGFALGQPELIGALRCVRDSINSYTVDRLSAAVAQGAVEDRAYFEETREKIIHTRERTAKELRELGFLVADSRANFLFIRHPEKSGKALFDALRARGILVRRWDMPRIAEYLRISIGTEEEMAVLRDTLAELVR